MQLLHLISKPVKDKIMISYNTPLVYSPAHCIPNIFVVFLYDHFSCDNIFNPQTTEQEVGAQMLGDMLWLTVITQQTLEPSLTI